MKYPTITKHNLDTWNDIVYSWIIQGMMAQNKNLKYGEAMRRSEKITNLLFKALKEKLK